MALNRRFLLLFAVVVIIALGAWFSRPVDFAYADAEFKVESVTQTDENGVEIPYDTAALNVGRGIVVNYSIPYSYYSVRVETAAGVLRSATGALLVVNQKASYRVDYDGYLRIICTPRMPNGDAVDGVTELITYVKSDNAAPNELHLTQMTEWRNTPLKIDAIMPYDNGLSGIRDALISVSYRKGGTERYTVDGAAANYTFTVTDNCDIRCVVTDNCGNSLERFYYYNMFDFTPPARPSFVFTGNVDEDSANGYVRQYAVEILCGEDKNSLGETQSGADESSVEYVLNGERKKYEGTFYVNEQRINTLSAYYYDNAGNLSPRAETEISNIDATEPVLSDYLEFIKLSVDLTKDKPYKLSVVTVDLDSGIAEVSVAGLELAFVQTESSYVAEFDGLDLAQLSITVYDRVGNFSTVSISSTQFGNPKRVELAEKYNAEFQTLKKEDYSDSGWERVINAYSRLSILLTSFDATDGEFNGAVSEINSAVDGVAQKKFKIASAPEGLSGRISYDVDTADIPSMKKGDSVTLIYSAAEGDYSGVNEELKAKSGFSSSLVRYFRLSLLHNLSEYTEELSGGIAVYMSYPTGFEGRKFKIADLSTNEIIDSKEENGSMFFRVKKTGNYAVIFEKNASEADAEKVKGVNIGGKLISYGWFFGSLSGIIVLTAALVVIVTVLHKKAA